MKRRRLSRLRGEHCGRGQRLFNRTTGAAGCRGRRAPIAWYKAHGLIDKDVNARDVVDLNFVK
jgi:hypothetical protein